MTTSRSDLIKAKLLLLVFSGKECKPEGKHSDWVLCNGTLYGRYMVEELVKEGHFYFEDDKYIPSTTLYNWDWFKE